MPSLKDLLKKKNKIEEEALPHAALNVPELTFIRSTTSDFETILTIGDEHKSKTKQSGEHRRTLGFRSSSHSATTQDAAGTTTSTLAANAPVEAESSTAQQFPVRPKSERRISDVLHMKHRSRSRSGAAEASSSNLPMDLPDAPQATVASRPGSTEDNDNEAREAQWEKRATILAMNSPLRDGRIVSETSQGQTASHCRTPSVSISDATDDINIQEAIRLHEAGDLTRSTAMFEQLADPNGANNALAQVLFGLALRHGWGTTVEPQRAIYYLSTAASNSASIEEQALASGVRKGGAAKGELTLAIYELANCFRHGWGVKRDPVAARSYYETAANLGDTDAMDQAAQCYLEGFGGAKDKFKAAQLLRLAESKGSKRVGETWIWKPKYNPPT